MKDIRCIGGLLAVATVLSSGQAMAQSDSGKWDWRFTPYLWGAAIDGDVAIGPVALDIDMDFSEIVDVLAGAALFRIETGNDKHGITADMVWLSLEPDDGIATVGGTTSAEFDTFILDSGYYHKLGGVDIELGARYWDFELDLDPALLAPVTRDDSWVDGYVGVRMIKPIGNDWLWQLRLNAGAGGSDFTFGAETHLAREFKSGNKLVFGLKSLSVDYEDASDGGVPLVLDTNFLGGTIGFMFD